MKQNTYHIVRQSNRLLSGVVIMDDNIIYNCPSCGSKNISGGSERTECHDCGRVFEVNYIRRKETVVPDGAVTIAASGGAVLFDDTPRPEPENPYPTEICGHCLATKVGCKCPECGVVSC